MHVDSPSDSTVPSLERVHDRLVAEVDTNRALLDTDSALLAQLKSHGGSSDEDE